MIIEMDDREKNNIEIFAKLIDENLVFMKKRLEEGDYVWRDIVVERKQIDDFCSSLMSGRLESQLEKMKLKYKKIYLIVVGRIKDRTSEIHEHSILGMMVSCLIKHNVNVLVVDDEWQFIYVLKRIMERWKEKYDQELVEELVNDMEVKDENENSKEVFGNHG